eukprot:jgi/Chrzof1/8592/Cz03g16200.t1
MKHAGWLKQLLSCYSIPAVVDESASADSLSNGHASIIVPASAQQQQQSAPDVSPFKMSQLHPATNNDSHHQLSGTALTGHWLRQHSAVPVALRLSPSQQSSNSHAATAARSWPPSTIAAPDRQEAGHEQHSAEQLQQNTTKVVQSTEAGCSSSIHDHRLDGTIDATAPQYLQWRPKLNSNSITSSNPGAEFARIDRSRAARSMTLDHAYDADHKHHHHVIHTARSAPNPEIFDLLAIGNGSNGKEPSSTTILKQQSKPAAQKAPAASFLPLPFHRNHHLSINSTSNSRAGPSNGSSNGHPALGNAGGVGSEHSHASLPMSATSASTSSLLHAAVWRSVDIGGSSSRSEMADHSGITLSSADSPGHATAATARGRRNGHTNGRTLVKPQNGHASSEAIGVAVAQQFADAFFNALGEGNVKWASSPAVAGLFDDSAQMVATDKQLFTSKTAIIRRLNSGMEQLVKMFHQHLGAEVSSSSIQEAVAGLPKPTITVMCPNPARPAYVVAEYHIKWGVRRFTFRDEFVIKAGLIKRLRRALK